MIPTATNFRLLLFAFCLLIFDLCCAYPTPYSRTSIVLSRQETRLTSPTTVTQTERITTGAGTFIQTCIITLTPTVVDGVDMVRQEKTCTLTPDNGNDDLPGALPPASSSSVSAGLPSSTSTPSPTLTSTSDTLSSTSTDVPSSTTDLPSCTTDLPSSTTDVLSSTDPPSSSGVLSSTVSPDSTFTGLPPASSGSVPLPVVSVTLTSVSLGVSSSVSSSPSSTSTSNVVASSPGVPVVVIGITSVPKPVASPPPEDSGSLPDNISSSTLPVSSTLPLPLSSSSLPLSPSPSSTPTPENAGAPAPFDPPGKKLEVLPIGLGVFAGVSVVALIAVGIVTYERAKHRRRFRKLKLEEQMGYGAA